MSNIVNAISRRGLFRKGGLLAASGLLRGKGATAATAHGLEVGPALYQSIGVRPLVNARGTFTIISGSQSLPEVKRAMEAASRNYVQMDELMDAVGRRLAELTQSDWGIVTAGCAAALTHATSACIAGADPEKMQRIPNLAGMKNEVIMPRHSRNVYDHAVRMTGVKTVTVDTPEEFEAAFNPRTAMVMVLSSPKAESGPMGTESLAGIARRHKVPLIVDAAAENLTTPSKHLQRGATMVAYSGGKCLRGPQAAGLLLGDKQLLQAAWLNSAPHHAFGRSLKVGKEEIMGMLAAVEMWRKRDHDAEWRQWMSWLNDISARVTKVPGVTTEVLQPEDLSNHAPELRIKWDGAAVGITGKELEALLLDGNPRIAIASSTGDRRNNPRSSATIMPYMMMPGDYTIVGEHLYAALSKPPAGQPVERPSGPLANVNGQWNAHLDFLAGNADHTLQLEQRGDKLVGTHQTLALSGDLHGTVEANEVHIRSSHRYEGTVLGYEFTGTVDGDTMTGVVALGEYGQARWTAKRHVYA
ncbi:MAG: DegT/DnrJ/EryC1/StrS family aminotransferase [Bryobacteraceae bacterium]